MTPTSKGLYKQCDSCLFNKTTEDNKYPCILSHKDIRVNSVSHLERYFQSCGIHDERKIIENEKEKVIPTVGYYPTLF